MLNCERDEAEIKSNQHLVKANRIKHEAQVHPCNGCVGNKGEPEKLPQGNML